MSRLLNRNVEILCAGRKFTSPLKITFTINFSSEDIIVYDDGGKNVPDQSDVSIFNLNDDSTNLFTSGQGIKLSAGYGDDIGTILDGVIKRSNTSHSGVDTELKLQVINVTGQYYHKQINKTYAPGSTSEFIIRDILAGVGIIPDILQLGENQTYQFGFNACGRIVDLLCQLCSDSDSRIITKNASINIVPQFNGAELMAKADAVWDVNAKTGLLDIQPIDKTDTPAKYTIKTLLNNSFAPYTVVNVDSTMFTGKALICDGKHESEGNEGNFISECEIMPL